MESISTSQSYTIAFVYPLFLSGLLLAISSCSQFESEEAPEVVETAEDDSSTGEQMQGTNASDYDANIMSKAGSGSPYDFKRWNENHTTLLYPLKVEQVLAELGSVVYKEEKSMDYLGDHAITYHFQAKAEPHLDVTDSDGLLEVSWYAYQEYDPIPLRQQTVDNIQRVHRISRRIMSADGDRLVQKILKGNIVENEIYHGYTILHASCEMIHCFYVLSKSGKPPQVTEVDDTEASQ